MAHYDESHLRRLKQIEELRMGARMPLSFLRKQLAAMEISTPSLPKSYDPRETALTNKAKDKKRQAIVRSAIKVFTKKGYRRTKVQDIVRSLGISTGTFYIYFRNKKELFIEVVDDVLRNLVGDAAESIREEKDFMERIKIRGRVFYRNYLRYNEILYQLRAEMAGEDAWPKEKIKKIYHDLTKPVIREIQHAVNQKIIPEIDPDLMAYALTGLVEIMCLRVSLDQKYSYEAIEAFLENLLRGIKWQ